MGGQTVQQVGVSLVCIIVGLLLLERRPPPRLDTQPLDRLLYSLLPERVNRVVPKVMGTILLIVGLAILVGAVVAGALE